MELGFHLQHFSAILPRARDIYHSPPLHCCSYSNCNAGRLLLRRQFPFRDPLFHLKATTRSNTPGTSRKRTKKRHMNRKHVLEKDEGECEDEDEEEEEDDDFDPAAEAAAAARTMTLGGDDGEDEDESPYSTVLSLSEKPDRNIALLDDYEMEELDALPDPNHRSEH